MNNITIALCEEDRQRLVLLYYRLGVLIERRPGPDTEATPEPVCPNMINPDAEHPVDAVSPHAAPEPVAEPLYTQAPLYTLDDVRAVVQRLIGPGSDKRAAAQDIVLSYAPKLSAIPVDKYPEVMERLTALEKEAK